MKTWQECKNILCVRADNMGDVIMSGPAIRALRLYTNASITMLTSRRGALICSQMQEIDATLVYDLPWSGNELSADGESVLSLIDEVRSYHFDAAVIFTVYSQSALPAALTCMLAGIPKRLAYCRENPYQLLTDWLPDQEPYSKIIHQVNRDIDLVAFIGATAEDDRLLLTCAPATLQRVKQKLRKTGIMAEQWIVAHPGVSEEKRVYPIQLWKQAVEALREKFKMPIIVTGSAGEKTITDLLHDASLNIYSAGGLFSIEEFIALIAHASMVISVNTSTVHIAAAQQTPLLVLYALTNPQHTPWKTRSEVLYFKVDRKLRSKNEVVRYVSEHHMTTVDDYPTVKMILDAAERLFKSSD